MNAQNRNIYISNEMKNGFTQLFQIPKESAETLQETYDRAAIYVQNVQPFKDAAGILSTSVIVSE